MRDMASLIKADYIGRKWRLMPRELGHSAWSSIESELAL